MEKNEILETIDEYIPIRPLSKYVGSCVKRLIEPVLVRYVSIKEAQRQEELFIKYPLERISILNELAKNNQLIFPEATKESFENVMNIGEFAKSFIFAEKGGNNKENSDSLDDSEWLNRFIDNAAYVSDVDLQKVWGRLLAEKILRPENVNKRVLRFLCDLDIDELDTIKNSLGYFKLEIVPQEIVIDNDVLLNQFLRLIDLGLATQYSSCNHLYSIEIIHTIKPKDNSLDFPGVKFIVPNLEEEITLKFPVYYLTTEGKVICKLLEQSIPKLVIDSFTKIIKRSIGNKYDVEVKFTK